MDHERQQIVIVNIYIAQHHIHITVILHKSFDNSDFLGNMNLTKFINTD